MPLLHQVHATPALNEAALLFVDRVARPDRLPPRNKGSVQPTDATASHELCDPHHFLPRWWRAPESAE